jgi:cytidylate kinase
VIDPAEVAPLRRAKDAHLLCSDDLDAEQVLQKALAMVFGK